MRQMALDLLADVDERTGLLALYLLAIARAIARAIALAERMETGSRHWACCPN